MICSVISVLINESVAPAWTIMTSRKNVAISRSAPSILSRIIRVARDFCSFSNSFTALEPPVAMPRPVAPLPYASCRAATSFSSRASDWAFACVVARSTRVCAALKASAMVASCSGRLRIVERWLRTVSLVAIYRARPIWPWLTRAAKSAMAGEIESLRCR